jgi:hypothetical protein
MLQTTPNFVIFCLGNQICRFSQIMLLTVRTHVHVHCTICLDLFDTICDFSDFFYWNRSIWARVQMRISVSFTFLYLHSYIVYQFWMVSRASILRVCLQNLTTDNNKIPGKQCSQLRPRLSRTIAYRLKKKNHRVCACMMPCGPCVIGEEMGPKSTRK